MQPRDLEDVEVDEDMELDDELCRDIQMKLPDCLWQLDYVGRYAAGSSTRTLPHSIPVSVFFSA